MTQPPGKATVDSLQRPSEGPSTQTEARILRTTSYGATEWIFSAVTLTVPVPPEIPYDADVGETT